jgi:hypothetical protein
MIFTFSALVNGSSSVSLESESSTVSGDGHSTVSQETTIIRDPREETAKEGSGKRHSRFVNKMKSCIYHYSNVGGLDSPDVKYVLGASVQLVISNLEK